MSGRHSSRPLLAALAGLLLLTLPAGAQAPAEWVDLFNGRNLDGWEVIGDGVWTVMRDGTLLGQRVPAKSQHQSWLYTTREFREFDLRLEYWTRLGGNSGVSIRDTSRARHAVPPNWDRNLTPSHIGYEIQILNGSEDRYPSGSVYLFVAAKAGVHIMNDWNLLEIESRDEIIRVKLNGELVCEHPGDPARSKSGPIGLQLHDPNSVAMFRGIRIRELPPRQGN